MDGEIKQQLQKIQESLKGAASSPASETARPLIQKAFHDLMILEAMLGKSPAASPLPDPPKTDERLEQAKSILFEKDLEKLLHFGLDTIIRMTEADRGFLTTITRDGALDVFTARRIDSTEILDPTTQISKAILKESSLTRLDQPLIIDPASNPEKYQTIQRLNIGSVLTLPIRWEKEVVAILYLDKPAGQPPFTPGVLSPVMEFCLLLAPKVDQLRRIRDLENLESPVIPEDQFVYEGVIGSSGGFRDIIRITRRVAPSEATVLILGESGTGKELIAKAIHQNSRRKDGPFIAVNCTAIPADLIESELFGHEKGAFTGASHRKQGKFELAINGTLFLDEIGDLSLDLQGKLLRAIQERTIDVVGGAKPLPVNVRLIAATNRNLKSMVDAQKFREDLYFRLNVISLNLPPLRNRKPDIPLLIRHLTGKLEKKNAVSGTVISEEVIDALTRYSWPGNIRELENVLERAMILCDGGVIRRSDLPPEITEDVTEWVNPEVSTLNFEHQVAEFKQELLNRALEKAGGNKSQAARILGISRNYLHQLINKSV